MSIVNKARKHEIAKRIAQYAMMDMENAIKLLDRCPLVLSRRCSLKKATLLKDEFEKLGADVMINKLSPEEEQTLKKDYLQPKSNKQVMDRENIDDEIEIYEKLYPSFKDEQKKNTPNAKRKAAFFFSPREGGKKSTGNLLLIVLIIGFIVSSIFALYVIFNLRSSDVNKAEVYLQKGNYKRAYRIYSAAKKKNPHKASIYNGLGKLFYYTGWEKFKTDEWKDYGKDLDDFAKSDDYHQAMVNFKKAISLNSKLAEPHNYLGLIYYEKGWNEKALRQYEIALNIEPNNSEITNNLAVLYDDIKMYQEAIRLYKKIIDQDEKFMKAYKSLGMLYYKIKELDKAVKYWEKYLTFKPNDNDIILLRKEIEKYKAKRKVP